MMDNDEEEIFHDEELPVEKQIKLTARDQELLTILEADEDAYFTAIEHDFAKKLYFYLRKKTSMQYSDTDIEDFVQIALIRFSLWAQKQKKKSSDTFRVNHDSYLRSVADHVLFDEAKKKKKLQTEYLSELVRNQGEETNITLADHLPDPRSVEDQEQKIFLDKVYATIDALKEPYRTALILSKIEGKSNKEISELLNKPLNTVKSWIKRGRTMLKEALPEYKDYL